MTYQDSVWHQEKRVFSMTGAVTGDRIAKIVSRHNLYNWSIDIEKVDGTSLMPTYVVTFTKKGETEEI